MSDANVGKVRRAVRPERVSVPQMVHRRDEFDRRDEAVTAPVRRLDEARHTGIVVERVAGLRNLAELTAAPARVDASEWHAQRWADAEGNAWQEIDLGALARDPAFLQVST